MLNRKHLFILMFILFGITPWGANGFEIKSLSSWFGRDERKAEKDEPLSVAPDVLNLQDSFAQAAEMVKPAVVNITAVHVETYEAQPYQFYFGDPFEEFFGDFFGQPGPRRRQVPPKRFERRQQGMGSGVLVDPDGYILTNEHVVRGAEDIQVRIPDSGEDKVYKGKVVGRDTRSDLAVVKIKPSGKLPFARMGDSDKVRVGDWAIAIGSPFGLEQTVTVGIISAVRQSLHIEGKSFSNMLQTDAAINQGNSGGPLVNIRGEVIGINTAIYAPTGVFAGVGFAIPGSYAKDIMQQLIEKGRVVRGWLGVEIAPLNDVLANQFGVPDKEGVLINKVMPESPAEEAGVRRGDVVREFGGEKVKNPETLQRLVAKTSPETKVKVKILREGRDKVLTLTTGKMPDNTDDVEKASPGSLHSEPEETVSYEWEGAKVLNFSPMLAERFRLQANAQGVVVIQITPGSLAESMGLAKGDLIASINRQLTPDTKSFLKAAKSANPKEGLLLDVNRQGQWVYLSYQTPD